MYAERKQDDMTAFPPEKVDRETESASSARASFSRLDREL